MLAARAIIALATSATPDTASATPGLPAPTVYVNDDTAINVGSQLPQITAPVEIKGHASGSLMHLHGPGSTTALSFTSGAGGSVVRRHGASENFAIGISLEGTDATIVANVIGPNTTREFPSMVGR